MNEPEVRTLRQIRAARLLSERDLARMSGLTRTTVRKIEAGVAVPRNGSIRRLCAALELKPEQVEEFRSAIAQRSARAAALDSRISEAA